MRPSLDAPEDVKAFKKAELEIYQRGQELKFLERFQLDERVGIPWNQDTQATLTDFYQITMAYSYWKAEKHLQPSVFEVFFRTNPFKGEFTVLGGVNDVVRFINTFRFDEAQIHFLREVMPTCDSAFFDWLSTVDCSSLTVLAVKEGSLVFPREPLLRVEGPLALCQLLETTVLTLLNFASLMATNAARYRLAAGFDKTLLEFGLRRAQGPDGGMSASRYSFVGGFDATSNVRASFLFGLPCRGTHAHAYVTAFHSLADLKTKSLDPVPGVTPPVNMEFADRVLEIKAEISAKYTKPLACHEGELAAFIAYAQAFPNTFLALVDTYDVTVSGVPNFCYVSLALMEWGYAPGGIRLDSGDLAYLSTVSREIIDTMGDLHGMDLRSCKIAASNNINETVLHALHQQGHAIDTFGIGTHLVTCYNQPALGMVYKLCEINGEPVMKISAEISKTTLPCRKEIYRLYDKEDIPILDLIELEDRKAPEPGDKVYCQHISDDTKRCYVRPARVERLLRCVWRNGKATRHILAPSTSTVVSAASESAKSPSTTIQQGSVANRRLTEENFLPPEILESENVTDSSSGSIAQDDPDGDPANDVRLYDGKSHLQYLVQCRKMCLNSLKTFRADHFRLVHPTPYKVSASRPYVDLYRTLWDSTAPVRLYE